MSTPPPIGSTSNASSLQTIRTNTRNTDAVWAKRPTTDAHNHLPIRGHRGWRNAQPKASPTTHNQQAPLTSKYMCRRHSCSTHISSRHICSTHARHDDAVTACAHDMESQLRLTRSTSGPRYCEQATNTRCRSRRANPTNVTAAASHSSCTRAQLAESVAPHACNHQKSPHSGEVQNLRHGEKTSRKEEAGNEEVRAATVKKKGKRAIADNKTMNKEMIIA